MPWHCAVLAVFIALGIVFDMIGVAVTAADPQPVSLHGRPQGKGRQGGHPPAEKRQSGQFLL